MKTKDLSDEEVALRFKEMEDNNKHHLYCDVCDPEVKVALCGFKRGPSKNRSIITVLWRWPIILWKLRFVCKRCRELTIPHASLHADKVL